MAPKKTTLTITEKATPAGPSKKAAAAEAEADAEREARLEREKAFLGIKNPHIKKSYLRAGGERLSKNAYDPIRKFANEDLQAFVVKAFAIKGRDRKILMARDVKEALKASGSSAYGADVGRICA